jgi:hypothetical protein
MVRPDVFCAGIKEKYVVQKMGVPCKQLHNYDYGGPYAGFQGRDQFLPEIDRMVNARIWSRVQPPWEGNVRRPHRSSADKPPWNPMEEPEETESLMTLLRHTHGGEIKNVKR